MTTWSHCVLRLALLLSTWLATAAWACPTCSCGNPALLSMGSDQPYDGRLRVGTTFRAWQQTDGVAGVDQAVLRELRLDLLVSWSPVRRWSLVLDLPLQVRERTDVSLAHERGFGSGEGSVSARFLLLGAEGFRPRHLVSLVASVRLPTAPTLRDQATGRQFELDAQLGPGAFAPSAGVAWAWFLSDRWSTLATLTGEVPLEGRFGLRVGPGVQLVAWGQFQPWPWLGFRAGLDGRAEANAFLSGVADTSNAGVLLQAAGDVIIAPVSRLLLTAGARVPFADLRGAPHQQSPIFLVSLVLDV